MFTKRRFLFTFGSLTLASRLQAETAKAVNLLALGDWGAPVGKGPNAETDADWKRYRAAQEKVAAAMSSYARQQRDAGEPVDAVLALGDNFYQQLGDMSDKRWEERFEKLYPIDPLGCPFLFTLGNHDYEDGDRKGWQHQIAYARDVAGTRWRFPTEGNATWFRQDFGSPQPWLTVLMLNSNIDHIGLTGKSDAARWKQQSEWLAAELKAADSDGRRVLCAAHHPMFTNGYHWNGALDKSLYKAIRTNWLPLLGKVPFYLSAHDHNLQHIEHPKHPGTSFLLSGAGGGDHMKAEHIYKTGEAKPEFTTRFFKKLGFLHLRYTGSESAAVYVAAEDGMPQVVHRVTRPA